MTPKEKAKELHRKFYEFNFLDYDDSKQCALIAVDEILNLNTVWFDRSTALEDDYSDTIEYWEEVKTEIENL